MFRFFKILYWVLNVLLIGILLGIHFVLQERSYYDALRFYAFPIPLIICIVVVLSVFLKNKKFNLFLVVLLTVVWISRSFKIHFPETINKGDLEVVFWNASHDNNLQDAFELNNQIPDVLVLVEPKFSDLKNIKNNYPKSFFYSSSKNIHIFSKTPIKVVADTTSQYNSSVINFKTQNLNFYAVDVTGSTDVPRTWELDFVNKQILKTNKTVVLGDFNVPLESKTLNKLKAEFKNAFNEKGNGFRETWFYNLPLLSLDQIWVSKDVKVLKTQKISTFKSDHCMLKTYVRL